MTEGDLLRAWHQAMVAYGAPTTFEWNDENHVPDLIVLNGHVIERVQQPITWVPTLRTRTRLVGAWDNEWLPPADLLIKLIGPPPAR